MELPVSSNWSGFNEVASSTGSTIVDGEVLKLVSQGDGSRYSYRKIYSRAGEVFKVKVLARMKSGTKGSRGRIFIDWPTGSNLKNFVEIDSTEWRVYTLEYATPLTANHDSFIQIGFGLYTGLSGEVEFRNPQISIENTNLGAKRSVCHGVLRSLSGTMQIRTNWVAHNLHGVSYDQPSKEVRVITERIDGDSPVASRPIFTASVMIEGTGSSIPLIAKTGLYDVLTGQFSIKFIDSSTGLYVDLAALGEFHVSVEGFV